VAKLDGRLDRAVEIRAAGGDQTVLGRKGQTLLRGSVVVERIRALEADEPLADALSQQAAQPGAVSTDDPRVGDDRHAS